MSMHDTVPLSYVGLHKRLGYMITQPERPGTTTGTSSALCTIRDSRIVSERAMAYMMIKNTPSAEVAEIISIFLADNTNRVDMFFRKKLIALVHANAFSSNCIYRTALKKLSS